MRKILCFVISITMLLTLSACGNSNTKDDIVTLPTTPPVISQVEKNSTNDDSEQILEQTTVEDVVENTVLEPENKQSEQLNNEPDNNIPTVTNDYWDIIETIKEQRGVVIDMADTMSIKTLSSPDGKSSLFEMSMINEYAKMIIYSSPDKNMIIVANGEETKYCITEPSEDSEDTLTNVFDVDELAPTLNNLNPESLSFVETVEIDGIQYDILKMEIVEEPSNDKSYTINCEFNGDKYEFTYTVYDNGSDYIGFGAPSEIDPNITPETKWYIDLENKTLTNGVDVIDIEVSPYEDDLDINIEPTFAYIYVNKDESTILKVVFEQGESTSVMKFLNEDIAEPILPEGAVETSEEELAMSLFTFLLMLTALESD